MRVLNSSINIFSKFMLQVKYAEGYTTRMYKKLMYIQFIRVRAICRNEEIYTIQY